MTTTDTREPSSDLGRPEEADSPSGIDRREFLELTAVAAAAATGAFGWETAQAATPAASLRTVEMTMTVNGVSHAIHVEPRTPLVDTLRNDLGLTGSKKSCDRGECGACTVHVDGRRVLACMPLTIMQAGKHVETIEGLANAGTLHPVQRAFIEHDGMQCGFCTSGQVMSAVAVLNEVKMGWPSAATSEVSKPFSIADLSRAEIQERMSGNLCRCACYPNIVDAVVAASGKV